MNKSTLQVLKDARALISDATRWTRGELYDTYSGRSCALGAVHRASNPEWVGEHVRPADTYTEAVAALSAHVPYPWSTTPHANVWLFNDDPDTSHPDVLALFDKAIAKLEAAE